MWQNISELQETNNFTRDLLLLFISLPVLCCQLLKPWQQGSQKFNKNFAFKCSETLEYDESPTSIRILAF